MNLIGQYAKGILATLTAFLGALSVALQDGNGVSGQEWVTIASATVVAAGVVIAVPNAAKPAPVVGEFQNVGK